MGLAFPARPANGLDLMIKRILLVLLLAFAPQPGAADAADVRDRIVQELRREDYREIRISRTLLGRMRFVAIRPDARREIVVNPTTGVILRDYIRYTRSSSRSDDEDDDDDEDNDDEDDDDEDDDEDDDDEDDDDDRDEDDDDDRDDDDRDDRDDDDRDDRDDDDRDDRDDDD